MVLAEWRAGEVARHRSRERAFADGRVQDAVRRPIAVRDCAGSNGDTVFTTLVLMTAIPAAIPAREYR
jgi:hypothetical protein